MATMATASVRPLTRAECALAYALLGWSTEIVFTAIEGLAHPQTRDPRLRGHSYLWMGVDDALRSARICWGE
jgi:hypothetical protein